MGILLSAITTGHVHPAVAMAQLAHPRPALAGGAPLDSRPEPFRWCRATEPCVATPAAAGPAVFGTATVGTDPVGLHPWVSASNRRQCASAANACRWQRNASCGRLPSPSVVLHDLAEPQDALSALPLRGPRRRLTLGRQPPVRLVRVVGIRRRQLPLAQLGVALAPPGVHPFNAILAASPMCRLSLWNRTLQALLQNRLCGALGSRVIGTPHWSHVASASTCLLFTDRLYTSRDGLSTPGVHVQVHRIPNGCPGPISRTPASATACAGNWPGS